MVKILAFILSLLGLFLPLHGGVSVFLSENFRWWKEVCVFILCLILLFSFFQIFFENRKKNKKGVLIFFKKYFSTAGFRVWGFLFLIWGVFLILSYSQSKESIIAFRYLGFGVFVFLIVDILIQMFKKSAKKLFYKFCTFFVLGNIISILFGYWLKFGNGIIFVQEFYSKTVSSWVPGQVLPLYHQTSDGFIRMQGLASGPVEFGHLVLMALFVVLYGRLKFFKIYFFRYAAIFLFFGALYQSGSRSAFLGGVLLFLFYRGSFYWRNFVRNISVFRKNKSSKSYFSNFILGVTKIIFVLILVLTGFKYLVTKTDFIEVVDTLPISKYLVRMSDSDHFTRPVEVFKIAMENPILGHLGYLGPSARMHNLKNFNDDKALIAENVFVDVFAQMGVIGLIFYVLFFLSLCTTYYGQRQYDFLRFLIIFLFLMNLATLFDMTPLSLSFFLILVLGVNRKNLKETLKK